MDEQRETIQQIREFNRFYTAHLGFLNRNYLDSGYSVTETRILFELKEHRQLSANRLIDMLHLDKSYISRLIRHFEQTGLITRQTDADDKRSLVIELTPKGLSETDRLILMTNDEIQGLIGSMSAEARADLCKSMQRIIALLSNQPTHQEASHES